MNILITGTSRGIGHALVSQALESKHDVFAVTRDISKFEDLKRKFPRTLVTIEADVSTKAGREKIVAKISEVGTLDILVNNAGVLKKTDTESDLTESFLVNATVPYLLSKQMIPFLEKSKAPRVAQISTRMGSIEDNTSGGYYGYRASKAALNMLTKSLSIDHPKIRFVLMHPGWVKTEMGGADAPTEIADSAEGIWKVIHAVELNQSGSFKDFQGRDLPW